MASKKTSVKSVANATSTPVRNTPLPKAMTPAVAARKPEVTSDTISRRAYEIWLSQGGCEIENWLKAESELRAA